MLKTIEFRESELLNVAKKNGHLKYEIGELNGKYKELEQHITQADAAARELATARTRLDTSFFIHSLHDRENKRKAMANALNAYFQHVCNYAVERISTRARKDRDDLAANIKIMGDGGKTYKIVGRSTAHSLPAKKRMEKRAANDGKVWDLQADICLRSVSEKVDNEHVVRNLKDYRASRIHEFTPTGIATAPTQEAEEYYTSSLVVNMFIKKNKDSSILVGIYGEDAYINRHENRIYGFLTIDSINSLEFTEADRSIMHELSSNILSVVRLFDVLMKGQMEFDI
jgi:hypothetical protein